MRELWRSLRPLNQIALVIVAVVFVGCMVMLIWIDHVVGLGIAVAAVALTAFCFWFFFHDQVRTNRLRANGTPVEAVILAVEETGVTVQDNYPLAKLRLLVQPECGESYEATTKCLMDRFEIPAYQPGERIQVVVDPKHPKKVAVA
jgi:Protein of unknown function (DUF3592)